MLPGSKKKGKKRKPLPFLRNKLIFVRATFIKRKMETRTMRNFAIRNFDVILAYIALLCAVTAVGATKVMSDVPDAVTMRQQGGNDPSENDERFKKCLICGRSHVGPQENIINGDPVDPPNKYPWMVQVLTIDSNLCGGAILDGFHILTAAHCFFKENCPGPMQVCLRAPNEIVINLLTSSANEFTKGPPVEKIFIHPKYRFSVVFNDIAVVKLKSPITCNAFASPICLPPSNLRVPGKSVFSIAGWGKTGQPNGSPPLLEAKLMALDGSRCGFNHQSETGIICIIGLDGKTPCFGDSGGPMFYKEKVFYTVGITAAGTSQYCELNAPAMYTDVPKFMSFIHEVTGLQSAHEI